MIDHKWPDAGRVAALRAVASVWAARSPAETEAWAATLAAEDAEVVRGVLPKADSGE